jgi:hypothetical protein
MNKKHILCINTAGAGAGASDGTRLREMAGVLQPVFETTVIDIDRSSRKAAMRQAQQLLQTRYDLVYMESTSIAVGIPLIQAAGRGQKFIVSSGDPVRGFFATTQGPLHGAVFGLYEKALYKACAGFIGWTPYLTGRALEMGAPRGATIEGSVNTNLFTPPSLQERQTVRERLGIPPHHLVCGVVGSLKWSGRLGYCYGLELVETLKHLKRPDITMVIVGDGNGREELERRVPEHLKSRIIFTGRVPATEVPALMSALDIGFITQTLDQLGNYRLTTKLPEYLACGVPVAMSPIPGYYDYAMDAGWALPACDPFSERFYQECAAWLETLTPEMIATQAASARSIALNRFDYKVTLPRFVQFVLDMLA